MAEGPVVQPLEIATNVPMMTHMREQMMDEAMLHAIDEGRLDDLFSEAVEDKDDER